MDTRYALAWAPYQKKSSEGFYVRCNTNKDTWTSEVMDYRPSAADETEFTHRAFSTVFSSQFITVVTGGAELFENDVEEMVEMNVRYISSGAKAK